MSLLHFYDGNNVPKDGERERDGRWSPSPENRKNIFRDCFFLSLKSIKRKQTKLDDDGLEMKVPSAVDWYFR